MRAVSVGGGPPRRRAAIVLGTAVLALTLGGFAVPAWAHNYLVESSPAAGSVVTEQPGVVSLTTNDALLDLDGSGAGTAIQVRGPAGTDSRYYGDGCVAVTGATAEVEAELGAAGEYTVIWQVVSTDGHPISDEFTFDWQPAAGQARAEGQEKAPDCGGTATEKTQATDAAPSPPSPSATLSDLAWIGGAFGAVVLAVLATLLIVRRRG